MAKAKKTKSGSWIIRVYDHTEVDDDGVKHIVQKAFTAPTEAEANLLAAKYKLGLLEKQNAIRDITLADAIDEFINNHDAVLSPTTIQGYKTIKNTRFLALQKIKVKEITTSILEQSVNNEAKIVTRKHKLIAPKTIQNAYIFLSTVLHKYNPDLNTDVGLPALRNNSFRDILPPSIIFRLVKGTNIELPVLLAMWMSFSMSEILGFTKSKSVRDGYIIVKEVVVTVNNKPLRKELAKEYYRTRKLKLPEYIANLIDQVEGDVLVPISGGTLYKRWLALLRDNNMPHMTFHDLRHVNASVMAELKIPDIYAQQRGGWKTPEVMKKVYQHTFSEARQIVDQQIDDYFEEQRKLR